MWLIIATAFLCTVPMMVIYTEPIGQYKGEEEIWGYTVDFNINGQFNISKPDRILPDRILPEFCQEYNPPLPDFRAQGLRISAVKCSEYIWELKNRLEIREREKKCANYQKDPYTEITGGRRTNDGEFPHMGAVGWKATAGAWVFKCGSSLISPKFVLTAGHCIAASLNDTDVADVIPKIVRFGVTNIMIDEETFPIDVNISKIIRHPNYKPPKKYYDIALMELEHTVEFNIRVQPACLWGSFPATNLEKEATITGWGVTQPDSAHQATSAELQATTIHILKSKLCDRYLRCNRNWCRTQDHQLCAGKLAGGFDACYGDSGGPLQVKIPLPIEKEGSMHFVIGIISFGIDCAVPNQPGLYARVSSFIDWIEDTVWKEHN